MCERRRRSDQAQETVVLQVVRRSSHAARRGRRRAPRRLCPFGPQRTSRRDLGCACQQAHASPRFGGAARGARAAATAAPTLTVFNGARPRAPVFCRARLPRPACPVPTREAPRWWARQDAALWGRGAWRMDRSGFFGVPMRAHARPPSPPFAAPAAPCTRPRTWAPPRQESLASTVVGAEGAADFADAREWLRSGAAGMHPVERGVCLARARARPKNRRGTLTARGRPPSTRAAARPSRARTRPEPRLTRVEEPAPRLRARDAPWCPAAALSLRHYGPKS